MMMRGSQSVVKSNSFYIVLSSSSPNLIRSEPLCFLILSIVSGMTALQHNLKPKAKATDNPKCDQQKQG